MRAFKPFARLFLYQLGSALIVTSLLPGCGGKLDDLSSTTAGDGDGDGDDDSNGDNSGDGDGDGDGSGGTKAGDGSGGRRGGTGGSAPAAGGGPAGTGGSTTTSSDRCLVPIQGGPCDAYFIRYGYDHSSGRCTDFVYGGCGGNNNNFESLDACNAACGGGAPGPEQQCETVADCALVYKGCCGPCGAADPDDYFAVNVNYQKDLPAQDCLDFCGACESTQPTDVELACENNTCVAFDTKQFAQCKKDSDCTLRFGSACCGCGDDGPWLAFSDFDGLEQLVCEPMMSCRACSPPASEASAWCDDGICRQVTE